MHTCFCVLKHDDQWGISAKPEEKRKKKKKKKEKKRRRRREEMMQQNMEAPMKKNFVRADEKPQVPKAAPPKVPEATSTQGHFYLLKVPKAAPPGAMPYNLGPDPRSATASLSQAPAPGPKAPSGPPLKSRPKNTKNKVSAWGPHRKEFQKLRQFLDNKFDGLEQQIWILEEEWTLAAPDEDKEWKSTAFEGACIQMKMRMDDALQEMSECIQNMARCSEEEWIKRYDEDYNPEEG